MATSTVIGARGRALLLRGALAGLFGLAALPAAAVSCEELRATIEARIRGNGGGSFSVSVVEASTSAPGSVVGTCDKGARKIVYSRGASEAASGAPAPRPAPSLQGVITECDNGRQVKPGACKRP